MTPQQQVAQQFGDPGPHTDHCIQIDLPRTQVWALIVGYVGGMGVSLLSREVAQAILLLWDR